jgi:hypothetical protein
VPAGVVIADETVLPISGMCIEEKDGVESKMWFKNPCRMKLMSTVAMQPKTR